MATKPTAKQLAARKLFAARAKAGTLSKTPEASRDYARDAAVERAEASTRIARKVAARKTLKKNPKGLDAGSFTMTVNGKTKTRWFSHTSDAWAREHGLPYELESEARKQGAFVKFGKTRAYVCVDESADGTPVLKTWEVRSLNFFNKRTENPTPRIMGKMVSRKRNPVTVTEKSESRHALVSSIYYAVLFYSGKTKPTGKPDIVYPVHDKAHAKRVAETLEKQGARGLCVIEKTTSLV